MKTLNELQQEEMERAGAHDSPRKFLALFPAGPRNGNFIDAGLRVFIVDGEKCAFYVRDFPGVKALWV